MKKQQELQKIGMIIKKIDEFQAIGLPSFLLNEPQEFKDYITNRYKIINYTSNSVINTSVGRYS